MLIHDFDINFDIRLSKVKKTNLFRNTLYILTIHSPCIHRSFALSSEFGVHYSPTTCVHCSQSVHPSLTVRSPFIHRSDFISSLSFGSQRINLSNDDKLKTKPMRKS